MEEGADDRHEKNAGGEGADGECEGDGDPGGPEDAADGEPVGGGQSPAEGDVDQGNADHDGLRDGILRAFNEKDEADGQERGRGDKGPVRQGEGAGCGGR